MVVDKPIFVSVPFGVKRNIVFAQFLGYNVLAPRCAVPIGSPCRPNAGGGRQLTDAQAHGRAVAGTDDSCIHFEKELFSQEKPIFSIASMIVVVVVPVDVRGFKTGALCAAADVM